MKNLFEKPSFETTEINSDKTEGIFTLKNLSRGFGTTIGNSIRRVLISSIESAAPVAVKITGVKHEFQAIPGVEEDVVNIILNLKGLVLKIEGNEAVTLKLNVSKEGKITGKDIIAPANVEIISKNLEIANLEKDGKIEIEIIAINGRGYNTSKENKDYASAVGFIPMDSNYSPVDSVNYKVNEINTAKKQMIEEVVFDIKTNGSIEAGTAIESASSILISHYMLLTNLVDLESLESVISEEILETTEVKTLEITLEEMDLSQRSFNALKRAGYESASDLAKLSEVELTATKNLGKKSIEEVIKKLSSLGIEIK